MRLNVYILLVRQWKLQKLILSLLAYAKNPSKKGIKANYFATSLLIIDFTNFKNQTVQIFTRKQVFTFSL